MTTEDRLDRLELAMCSLAQQMAVMMKLRELDQNPIKLWTSDLEELLQKSKQNAEVMESLLKSIP